MRPTASLEEQASGYFELTTSFAHRIMAFKIFCRAQLLLPRFLGVIINNEIVRSGQNGIRKVAGCRFRVPGSRAGITQRREGRKESKDKFWHETNNDSEKIFL